MEIFGFSMPLTLVLIITAVTIFFLYDAWCHTYWSRRGLTNPKPSPVLGNIARFSKGVHTAFVDWKKDHGNVYGMYSFRQPAMVISDLDILKEVLVKSFGYFVNRKAFPLQSKPMDKILSFLEDDRWRSVRNTMTPSFSASKMKRMSTQVNECADKLLENIGKRQEADNCIECRDLYGSFVIDTIGRCAFGLQVDSHGDPNDPFVNNAKKAFQFSFTSPLMLLVFVFPWTVPVLQFFKVTIIPKSITDFFQDVVEKAIALRKSPDVDQTNKRIDFLQLMVNAEETNENDETDKKVEMDIHDELDRHHDVGYHLRNTQGKTKLTNDEIVAQAMLFFLAGYETTNTLLSFCSYLLATNPEVQEKLIAEVDEITPSRDSVGYSSIAKMPYMDMVICETLRIYPPAVLLDRCCTETFTCKNYAIPKGTKINIPVYAIHHDPEIWPDPDKFNPERFSKEMRDSRHPMAWLPFGAGPRNCIGMRFALMEAKMAVVRVLQRYRFDTCPKTEIPPKVGLSGFLSPPNGITLRVIPRTEKNCQQ